MAKIIGVMGSGTTEWLELAAPLGRWLAEQGFDLLTGGGGGSMLAICRAFSQTSPRQGRSVGIIPTQSDQHQEFLAQKNYPNPFVDISIITPLPRYEPHMSSTVVTRNYVNILTSDVVIALPGGTGTLNELNLAVRFSKPVICFGPSDAFVHAPESIEHTEELEKVFRFIIDCTQPTLESPIAHGSIGERSSRVSR